MEYIQRLPFILGASMSIIVGFVSFEYGVSQQSTYIRMGICLVVFFALGILIRNVLLNIIEDIEKKREELVNEKKEEENMQDAAIKTSSGDQPPTVVDYTTPDILEDFSPLTVSEVIKTKINR